LVASALLLLGVNRSGPALQSSVDTLSNVGRLLAEGNLHTAGIAVKALDRGVITDLKDLCPNQLGNRRIGLSRDFTSDDHKTCGQECLASNAAVWVVGEQGIQDGVADRISDLVGVPLSYGLGGKQTSRHFISPASSDHTVSSDRAVTHCEPPED